MRGNERWDDTLDRSCRVGRQSPQAARRAVHSTVREAASSGRDDDRAGKNSTRAPKVPDAIQRPSGESADCQTWLCAPAIDAMRPPSAASIRSTDSDHADATISAPSGVNAASR